MSDFIYQDYRMDERIKMLQNLALRRQTETYNRSLSEREIDAEKDRYTKDAIELARMQDEMKTMVDRYKSGIKSIETLMTERLDRIRTGQAEVQGMVYGIPNTETGRMNFYDKYGENVSSRALTPEEYQGRLFIGDDQQTRSGKNIDIVVDIDYDDEKDGPAEDKGVDVPGFEDETDGDIHPGEQESNIEGVDYSPIEPEQTTKNVKPKKGPEEDKPKKKPRKGRKDKPDFSAEDYPM